MPWLGCQVGFRRRKLERASGNGDQAGPRRVLVDGELAVEVDYEVVAGDLHGVDAELVQL